MKSRAIMALAFAIIALPNVVRAADTRDVVADLQRSWAVANYELRGDQQVQAFDALLQRADSAVAENPGTADVLIWDGIIKSSFAGIKGGLGALSLAKAARSSLEAAIELDDKALDGSAYTSLGTLYYKVPGWPVGFGSDKKAVQLLQKALEINPDGIDSNYFYADYLLQEKKYEEAEQYLLRAQQAAPRPDRPVADAGRKQEILAALNMARGKLGH